MSSIVSHLNKKNRISPPNFLVSNTIFEVLTGSVAYGINVDTSDNDIYGICIPDKDMIFPHLRGEIPGFGRQIQRFEVYQQHHIFVPDENKSYDLTIYNIVKCFQLMMENNPNMIALPFHPRRCILHTTEVGEMIRENRHMFLHKGCWPKFKGYAYAQLHKIKLGANKSNEKRKETHISLVDSYGCVGIGCLYVCSFFAYCATFG